MICALCYLTSLPRRFEEFVDRADADAFIRRADGVQIVATIVVSTVLAGLTLSGIVAYALHGQ